MSKTSEMSRRRAETHAESLNRDSKVYKAFLDLGGRRSPTVRYRKR